MMMLWPLIILEILLRVPGPAVLSLRKRTLFLNQDPQQTAGIHSRKHENCLNEGLKPQEARELPGEPYMQNANLEAGVLLD